MMTNFENRLTQGQFSFLPPLTDKQISAQIKYALKNNWAIGIEYTDDPHPRNTYWEMFGNPMFDLKDPAGILQEINDCRKTYPNHYIVSRLLTHHAVWKVRRCPTSSTVRRTSPALAWCVRKWMAGKFAIPSIPTQRKNRKPSGTDDFLPFLPRKGIANFGQGSGRFFNVNGRLPHLILISLIIPCKAAFR